MINISSLLPKLNLVKFLNGRLKIIIINSKNILTYILINNIFSTVYEFNKKLNSNICLRTLFIYIYFSKCIKYNFNLFLIFKLIITHFYKRISFFSSKLHLYRFKRCILCQRENLYDFTLNFILKF